MIALPDTPNVQTWPSPDYVPEWHQYDMHHSNATYRWLCSGIGGGKTAWGVIEDYEWCRRYPGIRGMLILPKFDAWETTVKPECDRWWPASTWECDWQRKTITIDTGEGRPPSTIFIRSAWNRQQIQNILGPTLGFFHIDEAARMQLGHLVWRNVTGRLRQADVPHRGGWITGSPMGFCWITDAWGIDTGLPDTAYTHGLITKRETYEDIETTYYVRGAETAWNTHNPPDYLANLLSVYGGDDRFMAQELRGRIISSEGLIFYNFFRPLHIVPHDVAMKIFRTCRDFTAAVDWGETAPAAMTWGGFTRGNWRSGIHVTIGEYYAPQSEAEKLGAAAWEITEQARRDVEHFQAFRWYPDPEDPASIRKWRTGFEYQGRSYPPVPGLVLPRSLPGKKWNQWKAGIDLLRLLMGYVSKVDHPAYPEGNRLGASRYYVSERCVNLIKEITRYRQNPIEVGKPIREGAVGDDHAIDCERYRVLGERMRQEIRPQKRRGF